MILTLASCEIIGSIFNKPPTVSLEMVSGDVDVYSDETVSLKATMRDPDDDRLSFTWSIDGVAQDTDETEVFYTAPSASEDTTQTLSIRVSDGFDTVTASLTFNVTASGTLYVYNNAYYPLYCLYVAPSSSTSWGEDFLGSSMLATGSTYKLFGMSQGSWDIRYSFYADGSSTAYTYKYNNYFYNGIPRTLSVLAGGTWAASHVSSPSGSIHSVPENVQVRFAPIVE